MTASRHRLIPAPSIRPTSASIALLNNPHSRSSSQAPRPLSNAGPVSAPTTLVGVLFHAVPSKTALLKRRPDHPPTHGFPVPHLQALSSERSPPSTSHDLCPATQSVVPPTVPSPPTLQHQSYPLRLMLSEWDLPSAARPMVAAPAASTALVARPQVIHGD